MIVTATGLPFWKRICLPSFTSRLLHVLLPLAKPLLIARLLRDRRTLDDELDGVGLPEFRCLDTISPLFQCLCLFGSCPAHSIHQPFKNFLRALIASLHHPRRHQRFNIC